MLWYPGRPPFCSDKLLRALTCFIETTYKLIITQDATYLETLTRITKDALKEITNENISCNGTDHVLNTLHTLFDKGYQGILLAYHKQAWKSILEIVINLYIVHDELHEQHVKIQQRQGA